MDRTELIAKEIDESVEKEDKSSEEVATSDNRVL
jgi:hypothetical protein